MKKLFKLTSKSNNFAGFTFKVFNDMGNTNIVSKGGTIENKEASTKRTKLDLTNLASEREV